MTYTVHLHDSEDAWDILYVADYAMAVVGDSYALPELAHRLINKEEKPQEKGFFPNVTSKKLFLWMDYNWFIMH